MITLETPDGKFLELQAGTTLPMQYNSPFFIDNVGNADFSLEGNFAGTGKNKINFEFFNRPKGAVRNVEIDSVTMKDDGTKIAENFSVIIDKVIGNHNNDTTQFSGQVIGNKYGFWKWLGTDENGNTTKKLSDIVLLQNPIANPTGAIPSPTGKILYDWATYITLNPSYAPHICFPSVYYNLDNIESWSGYDFPYKTLNYWDDANNRMGDDAIVTEPSTNSMNRIVPMFKVYWVIEQILADAGYTIGYAPILSNADFRKVFVFNLFTCTPYDYYHTSVGAPNGFHCVPSNHMPDQLVLDWLSGISINFGLKFVFKQDFTVDVIQFNDTLDSQDYDDITDKVDANFIKTATLLTGMDIGYDTTNVEEAYANTLQNIATIQDAINSGSYHLEPTQTGIVGASYATGDIILVQSYNKWLRKNSSGGFDELGNNIGHFVLLDGAKQQTSLVSSVYDIVNTARSAATYAVPNAVMIGTAHEISEITYASYSDANMQLVAQGTRLIKPIPSCIGIYHGIQSTLTGGVTSFGSCTNYLPDTTTKLNSFNLGWAGTDGLFKYAWGKWALITVQQIAMQYRTYFDANDFASLNYGRKKRIRGVNYLLHSIKVDLPLNTGKQTAMYVLAEGIDL